MFIHQLRILSDPLLESGLPERCVSKHTDHKSHVWDLWNISKSHFIYPKHDVYGATCHSQAKEWSLSPFRLSLFTEFRKALSSSSVPHNLFIIVIVFIIMLFLVFVPVSNHWIQSLTTTHLTLLDDHVAHCYLWE